MRILFFGDVVGRSGRTALQAQLPPLIAQLGAEFVVVNAENLAGGFGLTPELSQELFAAGADVLTTGNHVWDQRVIIPYIDTEPRILRPLNFPSGTPGRGAHVYATRGGRKVLVVNVMGRLFMDPLDDPFAAVERALVEHRLGETVDAAIVDVHAEATSEKMAIAHLADGRASLVVGTHSHVPTADAQILPGGTAYQTDAGMCGDYDSVIGMKKEISLTRFMRKMPGERLAPAEGPATVCGLYVETDDKGGLARRIEPVRLGGRLAPALPEVVRAAAD
ncbi:MAG TPA: TIGR00282 family metallophosphoesterase [Candidatus Sulfotelmatobacter sp.]|nr:TIGR00282 family metallophosphoesterase [Candidatus Sulfotelmatobacter sp.]